MGVEAVGNVSSPVPAAQAGAQGEKEELLSQIPKLTSIVTTRIYRLYGDYGDGYHTTSEVRHPLPLLGTAWYITV